MKTDKLFDIILLVILFLVCYFFVVEVFNYPKDYQCYKRQCVEYNTNSCEYLGSETTGFYSNEEFYNCDGIKVAKRCSKFEDVKQDLEPNILDILTYKCTKLGEKLE